MLGTWHDAHIHDHVGSSIRIVCGEGEATFDGKMVSYRAGDEFDYPEGVPHGFKVRTPTILLTDLSGHIQDPKRKKKIDFRYADE